MTPILIGCGIATTIMFSLFFVAGNLDYLLGREVPVAHPEKQKQTKQASRPRPQKSRTSVVSKTQTTA